MKDKGSERTLSATCPRRRRATGLFAVVFADGTPARSTTVSNARVPSLLSATGHIRTTYRDGCLRSKLLAGTSGRSLSLSSVSIGRCIVAGEIRWRGARAHQGEHHCTGLGRPLPAGTHTRGWLVFQG